MRKIINSTYITLDGVVEEPQNWHWSRPADPRTDTVQTDLLLACDAVLMGRRTYDSFAAAWPSRSGAPLSDRMNSIPKYVVSTTLKDPDWSNTTVIANDVVAEIRKLKQQPGQDIVQYGFGTVSTLLMETACSTSSASGSTHCSLARARPTMSCSRKARRRSSL